jgi:diamine N-acetyltransferase
MTEGRGELSRILKPSVLPDQLSHAAIPEAMHSNLIPSDLSGTTTPNSSHIFIRAAIPSDASSIAHIGRTVFHTTFAHTCSKKDMDDFLDSTYTTDIILRELHDPNRRFLVSILDDRVVAFSQLTMNTDESSVEQYAKRVELQRIYVDNNLHGKGAAGVLMEHTLELARSLGYEHVWLGVWENNVRAFRFYQKFGFTQVGQHTFMVGEDKQTDWIVVKKL